jgi:hypothetical protein
MYVDEKTVAAAPSLLYKGKQPPSFFLLAERQTSKTKTKKHGAYSILHCSGCLPFKLCAAMIRILHLVFTISSVAYTKVRQAIRQPKLEPGNTTRNVAIAWGSPRGPVHCSGAGAMRAEIAGK